MALLGLLIVLVVGCDRSAGEGPGADSGVTFTRDVAAILYDNCVACHRPGESAPFSLLTYEDARRRADQIVEVTSSRFMPPWLPTHGEPPLVGERVLDAAELLTLRRWADAGTPRGDPADLPDAPAAIAGWQLGEPDLIVTMDESYTLPAEGVDVFRNLVIPVSIDRARWIEAVELRPGNKRIVHHAILQIDRTPASRELDARDAEPGFGGMEMGSSSAPSGQFIGWTPGKRPTAGLAGMAWRLDRGSDLVLQLHMLPTGKPETIRPSIGFHFADAAPELLPSIIGLFIEGIDIPANEQDYVREDQLTLPVPVELFGVYAHAHYLGKTVRGWAELPDGSTRTLIDIKEWNFNWQDDYRYVESISLPAGATIFVRWQYDNSSANVRNPNQPPKRVMSGEESSDEMGSLAFMVLTATAHDHALLAETKARYMLGLQPDSPWDHNDLGNALQKLGRFEEALPHYDRALELQPELDDARYNLGVAKMELGRIEQAIGDFSRVLQRNPDYAKAHNNLGNALLTRGNVEAAMSSFRRAAELQPSLEVARYNLGNVLLSLERYEEAIVEFRAALEINPRYAMAHNNLGTALHLDGRLSEAIPEYQAALTLEPEHLEARTNLGVALLALNRRSEAIEHFRRVLEIAPAFAPARAQLDAALSPR